MKVLQLIDSLNPGGAERMAVNYANLLQSNYVESHICVTREEGLLKDGIGPKVYYAFLRKKTTLDIPAIIRLRNYIKAHKIDIIHAHSTSFFLATIIKISYPNVRMIWHDHYGNSEFLNDRKTTILKYCSKYFDGIISVNTKLKNWSLQYLKCNKVFKINNFVTGKSQGSFEVKIKGDSSAFKIICVANLRPQKDHETLLKAFEFLVVKFNMSLHLIGNDPKTIYSERLIERIKTSPFEKNIFYYGSQKDVFSFLEQCDIGVLSSNSEGLPLSLLEYGVAELAVLTTNVGQCANVLNGNGRLVPPGDSEMLANEILFYFNNEAQRNMDAHNLKKHIVSNYSEQSTLDEIMKLYLEVLST